MSPKRVFRSLREQALTLTLSAVLIAIGTNNLTEVQAGQTRGPSCSSSVTVEQDKTYSYFQAMKASEGGHIVLHYGSGIRRLGPHVDVLQEDGYPISAMAGGLQGVVRVFINGRSSRQKFDQSDIDNGFLGGMVAEVYDKLVSAHKLQKPVCGSQVAGR